MRDYRRPFGVNILMTKNSEAKMDEISKIKDAGDFFHSAFISVKNIHDLQINEAMKTTCQNRRISVF